MYRLNYIQSARQAVRLSEVVLPLKTGFIRVRQAFIAKYPSGPLPFVVEGFRTFEQQAENYAKGRTTPGPRVTNRPPGSSKHERSPAEAIDIGFLLDSGEVVWNEINYRRFYDLWKAENNAIIWGGLWTNPHDPPHFELRAQ